MAGFQPAETYGRLSNALASPTTSLGTILFRDQRSKWPVIPSSSAPSSLRGAPCAKADEEKQARRDLKGERGSFPETTHIDYASTVAGIKRSLVGAEEKAGRANVSPR